MAITYRFSLVLHGDHADEDLVTLFPEAARCVVDGRYTVIHDERVVACVPIVVMKMEVQRLRVPRSTCGGSR